VDVLTGHSKFRTVIAFKPSKILEQPKTFQSYLGRAKHPMKNPTKWFHRMGLKSLYCWKCWRLLDIFIFQKKKRF